MSGVERKGSGGRRGKTGENTGNGQEMKEAQGTKGQKSSERGGGENEGCVQEVRNEVQRRKKKQGVGCSVLYEDVKSVKEKMVAVRG